MREFNYQIKSILLKRCLLTTTAIFGLLNSNGQGLSISNTGAAPAAGSMLHVYGTARLGSASGINGELIFNNSANSKGVTIRSGVTANDYTLILPPAQTTAPNYTLLNDGSGNLFWGSATIGTEWQLLGTPNTDPAIHFLGTTDAQPLRLATNGTERIRINANANEVGIGMTAGSNNTLDITNTTTAGKGINVTANSLTNGTILNLSGTSLTSGSAIAINAGTTTGNVIDVVANNLTSGSGLKVSSLTTALTSNNCLGNFSLNGNNVGNSGTVLKINNAGALNTGTALMIDNAATGASLRVNDDGTTTDTTPFILDANGNVGIGLESPNTKMDIQGDISVRESAIDLGINPGTINNYAIGNLSFFRFTGPTNDYTFTGFAGGVDGKILILVNHTNKKMSLKHEEVASTATNRIWLYQQSDVNIEKGGGCILVYSSAAGRWFLVGNGKP